MKKVFFIVSFLLLGTSFFASNEYYYNVNKTIENKTESINTQYVQVEYLLPESAEDMRPCRWRTCYHYSDGSVKCGPWTYGYCLEEVQL